MFEDVSDRCQAVQQGVQAGSLPANAFGRTTHAPRITQLYAQFQTKMAERMGGDAKAADQLSNGVRQSAVAYQQGDQRSAESYTQVGTSLNGDVA